MRQIHTSLASIARALGAKTLHLADGQRIEQLFVRLGTMDIRSFWKISERENIPAAQSIIIVGDRRDIQHRAIGLGIRALVITSNLELDPETVALARAPPASASSSAHMIRPRPPGSCAPPRRSSA